MTTTTIEPGQAGLAVRLRELAEALDALAERGITGFSLYVAVRPGLDVYQQADQVAMVDALAEQLGLVAAPVQSSSGGWSHEVRTENDSVRLAVTTFIEAPPQRCACGAACTHEQVTR